MLLAQIRKNKYVYQTEYISGDRCERTHRAAKCKVFMIYRKKIYGHLQKQT